MYFKYGFFTFLIIFLVSFSVSVKAQSISLDGFWTIEVVKSLGKEEPRTIKVDAILSSNYGKLSIEPGLLISPEDTTCYYYFEHVNGVIKNIVLKPGPKTQTCELKPEISFAKIDDNQLNVLINSDVIQINEVISLSRRHGPIPDTVQSKIPNGFNIQDVDILMPQELAEFVLLQKKGYQRDRVTKYFKGMGWKQAYVNYTNGDSQVFVLYSVVSEFDEGEVMPHVVLISRHVKMGAEKAIGIDLLNASLDKKYGVKVGLDPTRFYDREGNIVPDLNEMSCDEETNLQKVSVSVFSADGRQRSRSIYPGCGSEAQIQTEYDQLAGYVATYDITLWNFDVLIENDWQRLAVQCIDEAKRFLSVLDASKADIDL